MNCFRTSTTAYQLAIVAMCALLLAASLVRPLYAREQWLQHPPTVLGLIALAVTARRRWLSNASATYLVAMLTLHIIGARWIYSYVPYDQWCDALFGGSPADWFSWERNHYDRFIHFAFGVLMIVPLVEFAEKQGGLNRRWALLFSLVAIGAASAAYEVFEWLLAVTMAPQYAERYNGQQGDLWDGQKDMALALAGGTMTAAVLWRCTFENHKAEGNPDMWRRWPSLIFFFALCALAASTGRLFPAGPWYASLEKPPLTPPGWTFGVVWTVLYAMIALAGWLLWVHARRSLAMRLWLVQLVLNAAWTWLFFGLQRPGVALVEIVVLWCVIAATIVAAWHKQRAAAWLFVPYAAWVAFATYLNAGFWALNSP